MLIDISNLITPEVYKVIYRMGHMDELVIADANYSASAVSSKVVYSYASENHVLLAEILKYFPLDEDTANPVAVMTPDHGYSHDPEVWSYYGYVFSQAYGSRNLQLAQIPRQAFYERTKRAYATIQTTDPRVYADIIIRKGFVV
jgi:L-fucose mutarotase